MNLMSSHFETLADAGIRVAPVGRCIRKRCLDFAFSALLLLVLAPLFVLIAAAIKLESKGPVFFRQQRTGLGGAPFTILKFRSMRLHDDQQVVQASRRDARITPVGALMRALSIDELPQLLNVLRGDMSLVGPRPHALAHDARWTVMVPEYRQRFRARPGLTGYAQVRGNRGEVFSTADITARVLDDNAYIEQWSLMLDFRIILNTVPLIFADPNAY